MFAGSRRSSTDEVQALHILVVSNHWRKKDDLTFCSVWVDRQVEALRRLGVRVSLFDSGTSHSPLHLARACLDLRRKARELRPDLVHARYGTLVGLVAALAGVPMLITYGGSDLMVGAGISRVRAWLGIALSNFVALKARRIMCVSEELRRALWWRQAEVVVIPDGVNLELFKPQPREQARRKLGWSLDEEVVLMDALRDPICKGLALGETAMELVKQKRPQARLELLCQVKPTDMPLYCCAADVLLCASRREGSPNIVKEAMACNLPVVSVPVGDVLQRLAKVTPSRIVPRRPEAIAEGLCELLALRQRSNGRDHIQEVSLEHVAQRVVAVYKSALGKTTVAARTDLEPPLCSPPAPSSS